MTSAEAHRADAACITFADEREACLHWRPCRYDQRAGQLTRQAATAVGSPSTSRVSATDPKWAIPLRSRRAGAERLRRTGRGAQIEFLVATSGVPAVRRLCVRACASASRHSRSMRAVPSAASLAPRAPRTCSSAARASRNAPPGTFAFRECGFLFHAKVVALHPRTLPVPGRSDSARPSRGARWRCAGC